MLTQRTIIRTVEVIRSQSLARRTRIYSALLVVVAVVSLALAFVPILLADALPGFLDRANGAGPHQPVATAQGMYTIYLPIARTQLTAQQLIAEALDSGRIDYGTSLVYRAYAMFGDPRLPAAFRGAGSSGFEAALYYEAQAPSLPATVKAQLNPFLVRPDHPDSVFNTQPAIRARGNALVPALGLSCNAQNWASLESSMPGVLAKVHAKCTGDPVKDEQEIRLTLDIIEQIWSPLTEPMGQPIPDAGGSNGGGSSAIDFYLVAPISDAVVHSSTIYTTTDAGATWPLSPNLDASSSVVLLNRTYVTYDAYQTSVTHEFFHVLQNSHTTRFAFKKGVEWWFREASAVWAETYVGSVLSWPLKVRASSYTQFLPSFQQSDDPLHTSGSNKDSAKFLRMYGAFVWPLFVEQETGGTAQQRSAAAMAAIWQKLGALKDDDWEQGLAVIDAQLSFAAHFHDFALRNLNIAFETNNPLLKKRYQQIDVAFPEAKEYRPPMAAERVGALKLWPRATPKPEPFIVELPALTADYYHFEIASEDVGGPTQQVVFNLADIAGDGFDVDAVVKYAGKSWAVEHWNGRKQVRFCFEQPDERLTEIYLVLSNHAIPLDRTVKGTLNVEVLQEPCDCSKNAIVAQTGSNGFEELGPNVSINDWGQVAFVGQQQRQGDAVYVAAPGGAPQQIRGLLVQPGRSYMPAVQISSAARPQVVARAEKQSEAVTQLWRFDAEGENNSLNVIATGRAGSSTSDFDSIATHPSINAKGQMAFVAIKNGQRVLVTADNAKQFYGPVPLGAPSAPMIADDGQLVVYDTLPNGSATIRLYPFDLGPPTDIACASDAACAHPGFTLLGNRPGISGGGRIVTFYGEVAARSADSLHTEPGPGIFASIAEPDGRKLVRVADIDRGFSDFGANARVAASDTLEAQEATTLVYLAADDQERWGVYAQRLIYTRPITPDDMRVIKAEPPLLIARQGLRICGLSGVTRNIAIHDPINNTGSGTVAFWVETEADEQAVIRVDLPSHGEATPTPTSTSTASPTTATATNTPTPTTTSTAPSTATATAGAVWTATPTATSTGTPTTRPTRTATPTITPTPTEVTREVRWISPVSGSWQTAANWSIGQVPGPNDDVIIDTTDTITVTYLANSTIHSLHSKEALVLSGGSLTINSASTIDGGLVVNNTLVVNGDLDVGGMLIWNGGSMSGPGATYAHGGLEMTSPYRLYLSGRTLVNYGRATMSRALFVGDATSVFVNRAEANLDLRGDVEFDVGRLQNEGTLTKSVGTGLGVIHGQLINNGSLALQSGQLRLDIFGASSSAGSISAVSQTELKLLVSGSLTVEPSGSIRVPRLTVDGGGQFTVLGAYDVSDATTIVNGTTSFGPGATVTNLGSDVTLTYGKLDLSTGAPVHATNLSLSGGELTGSDALTVDEFLAWTGGGMSGSGRTVIAWQMEISGPGQKLSLGRTLENHGTVDWRQGLLSFAQNAAFENRPGGTVNAWADTQFYGGSFTNAGLFRKDTSAGTTEMRGFVNNGTVEIKTGTVLVSNSEASTNTGTFTGEASTSLEWHASNGIVNRFTPESRINLPRFVFDGEGTEARVEGAYAVDSTTLKHGRLNLSTGGALSLPNLRLEGGELSGTSDISVSGALDWLVGTMSGGGKTTVLGRMAIDGPASINFGAVRLDRTLENRGAVTWRSGSVWVSANGTLINAPGALFETQADGAITGDSRGTGWLVNEGTVRKTGGTTTAGISVPFTGSGAVDVLGGTFQLRGTGANTMRFTGGPGGTLELSGNGPNAPTILAPGSRIEAPNVRLGGHTTLIRGSYNVTGTTTVDGLVTFDTGAQLANLGQTTTIAGGGDVTFNTGSPVLMHDLVMNPLSNLTATGDITVEGLFIWRGGVMSGPGTTAARGGIRIVGATAYTYNPLDYTQGLISRTLVNEGAATCDGCMIYADQGAVFENAASGSFRVTRDAAFARCTVYSYNNNGVKYDCAQQGTPPLFRNLGALITAGPGTLFFGTVPNAPPAYIQQGRPFPARLSNSGTIRVEGGGINLPGGYTQTGGSLELAGGAVAGTTLDVQGGSLVGTGTITGAVVNAGTVRPGGSGSTGTLEIVGSYRQTSAGRLEIELGGGAAGTQFDQLRVIGQAALDGTLAVSAINGFAPSSGDSFTVLACGSRSGAFATVSSGNGSFTAAYGGQDVRVVVP